MLCAVFAIAASLYFGISSANAQQVSINAPLKSGTLILLATQNTNLPSLTNTLKEPITVKIKAEGKWNFGQDVGQDKYGELVDANGNSKYDRNNSAMKFPAFYAATLVALKNNQPVASGKEQTIELLPGETVSFINNDAINGYSDNSGTQTINYSFVSKVVNGCGC